MLIHYETLADGRIETRRLYKDDPQDPFAYRIEVRLFDDPESPEATAARDEWETSGDPRLPAPVIPQPALNEPVDFSAAPAGTLVRVTNEEGDQVDLSTEDGALFADPGIYRVLISPPMPYHTEELVWSFA